MSRNKRRAARLIALLFMIHSACALAASELISPDQIVADEVKYKTCVAELGEYVKSFNIGGSEYYPLVMAVRYKGDSATYAETLVKRGQEVKAGDPLFRVTVNYDEVQMAERELAYERAQESFEQGKIDRLEAIDALQRSLASEPDEYERRMGALRLKKLNIALEQYVYQQEYALETRRLELEELNERHSRSVVTAPIDGVISELTYLREGDRVYNGMSLCRISSGEVLLIAVKDSRLRYGMPVKLEIGPNKNKVETTGRVVAAADVLRNVTSDYALVEPDDPEYVKTLNLRNIKVAFDSVRLENVLLVERKAIVLTGGKYVVTKLTPEGVTQKRYVTQGLANTEKVWVLQGLEPGETVIID